MKKRTLKNIKSENEKDEIQRIEEIFQTRAYDTDNSYSDMNLAYLHRIQSMERATIQALLKEGLKGKLEEKKILDYGCGNGRWFGRWLAWGASPSNMTGVDLRDNAIAAAATKFSACHFIKISPNNTPFEDEYFHIVIVNLVFSSILRENYRIAAAKEIARVLKPNGLILWCDFIFNNPKNKNVKAVHENEIKRLFPNFKIVFKKRIILAPPISRILIPISWWASATLESIFPFLRTHIFVSLKKSP